MAANSSSPSNFSLESLLFDCSTSKLTIVLNYIFTFMRIAIFLPLSILVLYWGHQQWRQKGSFKMMCNTDFFTCHQVAMELLWVLGAVVYICSSFSGHLNVSFAAFRFSTIAFFGQCLFHSLTCVDRYLAVVYPITYLRLRNTHGGRIRNISIGCVWLLSLLGMTCAQLDAISDIVLYLLAFTLTTISFCNIAVLCVLIRPGPGSGAKGRVQVDQSKRRAFYTIVVILVVVGFWFAWALVTTAVHRSQSSPVSCLLATFSVCFSLPSSAVLPLLFLHKAGKLSWCC